VKTSRILALLAWPILACLHAGAMTPLIACATCFGESDSPMAKGMNAGIFTLLVFVGILWVAFASFFVFIVKRSRETGEVLPGDQVDPHHN